MSRVVQHFNVVVECIKSRMLVAFQVNNRHMTTRLCETSHFSHGFWKVREMVGRQAANYQVKRCRRQWNAFCKCFYCLDCNTAFRRQPPKLREHIRRRINRDDARGDSGETQTRMPCAAGHIADGLDTR